MNPWILGVIIILLVMCSAFFSSAETAYSSVSKIRLKNYADNGNKKAKKALYIADHYDKALSTILIGNNIVNIAASSLATLFFVSFMDDAAGTLVSTIVLTIVVLIFGEVMPKNIAKQNSESLCMRFGGALYVIMVIMTPVTFLLLKLTSFVQKRASKSKKKEPSVTEDELKYIVESIEEEGVLEEQESELVQSALEFDEKTVYDVLTPRVDMITIDIEGDPKKIRETVLRERFSRIPVYQGNIDNIIGVLHTRDYLECMLSNEYPDIRELIQPAYFIYRSKRLSSLLADFRYKQVHIAIVTDEYGGTLGMVTMEDLLEQLVGEIWDEDEEIEKKYKKISENKYELDADMDIDDMLELIDEDEKYIKTDSKSVGGWVIEQVGDIPDKGTQFRYRGLLMTVKDVVEQRINSVIMEYTPDKQDDNEGI